MISVKLIVPQREAALSLSVAAAAAAPVFYVEAKRGEGREGAKMREAGKKEREANFSEVARESCAVFEVQIHFSSIVYVSLTVLGKVFDIE